MSLPLTTVEDLNSKVLKAPHAVVLFYAPWHPPSLQMCEVLDKLAGEFKDVVCAKVDAEGVPAVTDAIGSISSVPTVVALKSGSVSERLEGSSAPQLVALVSKVSKAAAAGSAAGDRPALTEKPPSSVPAATPAVATLAAASGEGKQELSESLKLRLSKLVGAQPVMLFMKGSPEAPKCGFSRQMVAMLNEAKATYGYFDILSDETVRQGLKTYSNWPTYPQLYINGELVGGLDICKELAKSGELASLLPAEAKGEDLTARLKALITKERVMLFMKGSPDAPQCGFSSKAVGMLREAGFKFGSFDILSDDTVRQGLKELSNWPTYPQLYVEGELVGGLDIMTELHKTGELAAMAKPKQ